MNLRASLISDNNGVTLQGLNSSKIPKGQSGIVRATGADPNDPALHGMPDEVSAKATSPNPRAGALYVSCMPQ